MTLLIGHNYKKIVFLEGDGSLQTQNQGKTYRYKFLQSNIHGEYFHPIIQEFKPWMHKKSRLHLERQVMKHWPIGRGIKSFMKGLVSESNKCLKINIYNYT